MAFFRNKHHTTDPLWHVQIVLAATIVLQLLLPDRLSVLPKYLLPALELVCLIGLQVTTPRKAVFTSKFRRFIAITLISAVAIANISSLEVLLQLIFSAGDHDAVPLLLSGGIVYITNIVIFSLLYWEMDSGGPGQRRGEVKYQDFVFPQQTMKKKWHPSFVDYLYVSTTNATAFSPTDTMPLSRRAKMVMAVQAFISLVVIALVAARAVNIL